METKDIERFWSKVEVTDDCWLWHGNKRRKGYGAFWHTGKTHMAHRVSYQLAIGEIPEGLFVCHHCDNPSCVRPTHLFTGTNRDNVRDMLRKGRQGKGYKSPSARGLRNGNAKISDAQVKEMRRQHESMRISYADLASQYGIKPGSVKDICLGVRRKYVK